MVKRIDWSKWDHLLGTNIDYEIAKLIGCQAPTVAKRRHKLKVKPFKPARPRVDWKKHKELLGSDSDRKVAAKIGCSAGSVSLQRRKMEIPAYK